MSRRNSRDFSQMTFEQWWAIYTKKFPGAPGIGVPGPHATAKAAWMARRGIILSRELIEKILDILPQTPEGFEVWMQLLQEIQDND